MMQWVERLCRLMEALMGAALAVMLVLVAGNLVLRQAFGAGLAVSDELARWLLVWMTFLGAVVAIPYRAHLGSDLLVRFLPLRARRACMGLGQLLMLFVCWQLFLGAAQQMAVNSSTRSVTMNVPMSWFHGAGVMFALLAGVLLLLQFVRLVSGNAPAGELGFAARRVGESDDGEHRP